MKHPPGVAILFGSLAIVGWITGPAAAAPAPASGRACGPVWHVVPSANVGTSHNNLYGVAASSPTQAWAVGSWSSPANVEQTLTERWDGTTWSAVSSPNLGDGHNVLYGVGVDSAGAWAVGTYNQGPQTKALALRWSGGVWAPAIPPNTTRNQNVLTGVAALAPDDAWAVGYSQTDLNPRHTLIEHWNGASWIIVASPNPGGNASLMGVSAAGADDVWATGIAYGSQGNAQPLAVHWDGTSWTAVPVGGGPGTAYDFAVAAVSSNEVWSVGEWVSPSFVAHPLAGRWDGAKWNRTQPAFPGSVGSFFAVAAVGSGDVWAAGSAGQQPLVEHWDGSGWSVTSTPSVAQGSFLAGAAALLDGHVWAVGTTWTIDHIAQTLIEQAC